ncbi:MAG: hypothetical protein ACPG5W_11255, partial [Flavobacteriales bacterium]
SIILLITSILFRYLLSWSLSNSYFTGVWIVAALYFVSVYVLVWRFSIQDKKHLPVFDLGFRFHLVTYLIWVLVSYAWFLFGDVSEHEHILQLHISSIIWGVLIAIHFSVFWINRKKGLKGLDRTEIFE